MDLKDIVLDKSGFPDEIAKFLGDAVAFDSSCESGALTLFIEKDSGYFLKIADKGSLKDEAIMMDYFNKNNLSAKVRHYVSAGRDYLITEKICGNDGVWDGHLNNPKKLCDVFAQSLFMLHNVDISDCPRKNVTTGLISDIKANQSLTDEWLLKYTNIADLKTAIEYLDNFHDAIKDDVLIHGDYCLPNIMLDDFKFAGFVDVGAGGVGDRHFDIFWALWTMEHNFKTNRYSDRFLDCYGRELIDEALIRLCGIISAFNG